MLFGIISFPCQKYWNEKNIAVRTSAILLLPFGWDYFEFSLFTLSYVPHVILYLLITALVFRAINQKEGRKRKTDLLLIVILSAIGGANGIRVFYNCVVPLAAVVMARILHNIINSKPLNIKELSAIVFNSYGFMPAVSALFGAIIGFVYNYFVLSKEHIFVNFTDAVLQELDFSSLLKTAGSFFSLFGWQSDVSVLGFGGLSSFSGLLLACLILSSVVYLFKHYRSLSENWKFLISYFCALCLVGSIFFAFSGISNLRYWIPAVPIAIAILGVSLEKLDLSSFVRKLFISILSFLFLISSCYPIYITRRTANYTLIQAEQWLEDHGYLQGYATYWNSNVLTELSNGSIVTWTVDLNTMTSRKWLEEASRENTKPEGKVFVLVNHKKNLRGAPVLYGPDDLDELHQNFFASLPVMNRGYEDENYSIYVFDSNEVLEEMLKANNLPIFPAGLQ